MEHEYFWLSQHSSFVRFSLKLYYSNLVQVSGYKCQTGILQEK
ncbi:hypothetical protein V6Z12_D07G124300 [Gossypium hirsutum]